MTDALGERLAEERRRTEELVASLRVELEDIIDSTRLVATDDEHDPEGSTIAFERSRIEALIGRSVDHLSDLDRALGMVADGRYGRCERCGESIAADRLAARPASTTCLRCAAVRSGGRIEPGRAATTAWPAPDPGPGTAPRP
jgi:DnaK suppressor protein